MSHSETCILYARKSTDREDKQILSIPSQLTELREFATRMGLSITKELTEQYSAREPGRPIFAKLLQDIAAGKVQRVLSWKLDRLARNPIDGGALIHYLGKGLLQEIVTPEGTYTGAGDSKFMLSVLFGAATKMTDDLSAGVKRGNSAVHESGRITGIPPIGYMKVRDGIGFRGAGKVVPDPQRFPIMQRVWQEFMKGTKTMAQVWRLAVNEWGLTTRGNRKHPSKPPTQNYFQQMLKKRFYAGEVVRVGKTYQGEHIPMVTISEFERVQALTRRTDFPRPSKHHLLYAGLLHCADCSRVLVGEIIKGRYIYYRCGRRKQGYDRCASPAPTEQQVTSDLKTALERTRLDDRLVQWTLGGLDWWVDQEQQCLTERNRALELEVVDTERQGKRLTDLFIEGHLEERDYQERRSEVRTRLERLRSSAPNPAGELELWRNAVREVMTRSGELLPTFKEGNDEERRELLVQLYENILVKQRQTSPTLRSAFALFDAARPKLSASERRDENTLRPSDVLLRIRKNARPRNSSERALFRWWTLTGSNR